MEKSIKLLDLDVIHHRPNLIFGPTLLKADSHTACRAHAVPLPCRAAKGLECIFPI